MRATPWAIVRRPASALGLALAAALLLGGEATAGTYVVHSCATPEGVRGHASDWTVASLMSPPNRSGSRCPGSYFSLDLALDSPHLNDDFIRATFSAPPDTTIQSYRLWRSVQVAPEYVWFYREDRSGASSVVRDRCDARDGCNSRGRIGSPFDSANLISRQAPARTNALSLNLICDREGAISLCPSADRPGSLQLHGARIVLEDNLAPQFAGAPSGPLVGAPGPVAGVVPLTISANDRGGGVYQASVEIDGAIIASSVLDPDGGRCSEPFRDRRPCKLSATGTLSVDTTSLPDGPHSLRVLVNDATKTNVTASDPVSFSTNNHRCNAEPAVSTAQLRARLRQVGGGRRRARARLTTRYGRKVRVVGSLAGASGGVAGAPVCVLVQPDTAQGTIRTRELVTDANGRFSFVLRRGPSRRLTFVHRRPDGAIVARARLGVRAPVQLRASRRALRNGQTVVLRGRLRGRPLPQAGAQVVVEARRGRRWQPFGTTRSRARGRYRFKYRFTRTRGVQVYSLRARVPRQAGYPYASGASRQVRIRVVG